MALLRDSARQLSNTTKTNAQWSGITPRWLLNFLPTSQVEAGTFRVNAVKQCAELLCEHENGDKLTETFFNIDDKPREYKLSTIQTVIKAHTQTIDLYNSPYDQLGEQFRIVAEAIQEETEARYIASKDFGLSAQCSDDMRVTGSSPNPDTMDDLLGMIWKQPAFFIMHPRAMVRFGQECTARGVCIGTVEMFGSPFFTWRGVPIVPSDKINVGNDGSTEVMLLRVGEDRQGVVGLSGTAKTGREIAPGITAKFNGTDEQGLQRFLLTRYVSLAVLVPDALGILKVKI